MSKPPLRVFQFATGNVGSEMVKRIVQHPDLELVGLYCYTPEKIGRDAGEIDKCFGRCQAQFHCREQAVAAGKGARLADPAQKLHRLRDGFGPVIVERSWNHAAFLPFEALLMRLNQHVIKARKAWFRNSSEADRKIG